MPAALSAKALARLRLDARLAPVRALAPDLAVPQGGWLRAIRQALGMSSAVLASHLGIGTSSAIRLETSERRGTIHLDSLRRAADALGCDVAYVLIPRVPLEERVAARRRELAQRAQARVRHHMALEDQASDDDAVTRRRAEHAAAAIRDQDLWPPAK